MKADATLKDGVLKSTQTFKSYGGSFEGEANANLTKVDPEYSFNMKLADIGLGGVAAQFAPVKGMLGGLLNTELAISGRGLEWETISKSLTGSGDFNLAKAEIKGLDLSTGSMSALTSLGSLAGFSVPKDLISGKSIDTIKSAFKIQDGKVSTEALSLSGGGLEALGKGHVGLDMSLDYEGSITLSDSIVKKLGKNASFLADDRGNIVLPFGLGGTLAAPAVAVDSEQLLAVAKKAVAARLKSEVKGKVASEINKLVGEKAGGDLLKGALGGVLGGKTDTDKKSGEKKADTKKEVTDLLGGLLKKKADKEDSEPKAETEDKDKKKEAAGKLLKGLFGK